MSPGLLTYRNEYTNINYTYQLPYAEVGMYVYVGVGYVI